MKKLLVTAALPYSNGRLHVGHIAGAYLPADIYVRYQRLIGRDVRFVCGSDDHGVAIVLSGNKEGKSPAEIAKFYHDLQKPDFKGLRIDFDVYGSTSQTKFHKEACQDFFLKLFEKGYFEKQKSQQFYDESKKMFLPDRFVTGTCEYCKATEQHGDQCEDCGKVLDVTTLKDATSVVSGNPASIRDTVHWFIDLSKFEDDVAGWLKNSQIRKQTKNYVSGLLSAGFIKRSMTRDLEWGIPLPIDDPDAEGKALYVWFDAPIGYISNTMELLEDSGENPQDYEKWWKSDDTEIVHFIGEDNTIFHCVIWIAMLKAYGEFSLPKGVIVNQFLNIKFPDREEEKISKSRGTAVWIGEYLESGGSVNALRYYLTAIAPEKARTVYNPEDLIHRHNTDLADTVGNFVNRIISFTRKYHGPSVPPFEEGKLEEVDKEFEKLRSEAFQSVTAHLDDCSFKQAQESVIQFAREANKYVDDKAPWKTRKTDMDQTCLTLALSLRAIHTLGVMLLPFLPDAAEKIAKMLSQDPAKLTWGDGLKTPEAGSALNEPEILFQKIE